MPVYEWSMYMGMAELMGNAPNACSSRFIAAVAAAAAAVASPDATASVVEELVVVSFAVAVAVALVRSVFVVLVIDGSDFTVVNTSSIKKHI